jgi:radical SAM protein with 4Fe4S-binding SPASM domain
MSSDNYIYKRTILSEKLPLKTPYAVDVFGVHACNFRCEFCGHGALNNEYTAKSKSLLDLSVYKKCVSEMINFPDKIKVIHFMGYGEPLLHKDIIEMIDITVRANVADSVDIITNGSLLTQNISDQLIRTGVNWIRISVNGLSSDEYKQNCKATIDYDKFVQNIQYLHANRQHTKIYIKILDYMVDTEERKRTFYETFRPISDTISIENVVNSFEGTIEINSDKNIETIRGTTVCKSMICPFAFYMFRITPEGDVKPCCEPRFMSSFGNIKNQSIIDIWNGQKFNEFRVEMLDGVMSVDDICPRCKAYVYSLYPEDVLDESAEDLKKYYK